MRNAWFLSVIIACLALAQGSAQQAGKDQAKLQALEQRVAALERQVRYLNYPELQEDARQAKLLESLRDKAHLTFKQQSALVREDAVEAHWEAMAAVVYWNLEVKLALQKQNVARASDCGLRAYFWACRWAACVESLMQDGLEPDLELVRDADESVYLASQQLLRLEKIAETLGKDVGELFDEREMRSKKIYGVSVKANNLKAAGRVILSAMVNGEWLERISAADLDHIEALMTTLSDARYRVEIKEEGTRRPVFEFVVKNGRLEKAKPSTNK